MGHKLNAEAPRVCPNCGETTGLEFCGLWFDDDDVMLDYLCHKCCCTFSHRYKFDQAELTNGY